MLTPDQAKGRANQVALQYIGRTLTDSKLGTPAGGYGGPDAGGNFSRARLDAYLIGII